tara:strand:+ start:106 stop:459 length:354 start_codon:yes stop_codon:yes gene_type:complete
MKTKKQQGVFQAQIFPSKKNKEQHVLVYKLKEDADDENAIAGFITLKDALESTTLSAYLGASEESDVLDCGIVTFSIPFALTLSHVPRTRDYVNADKEDRTSYVNISADDILEIDDL